MTSPGPAEGKTTVASNLSIAIAEMGRRVLFIDGDLRQPKLHKIFGSSNARGVSDVLLADTQLETLPLNQLVLETRITGVSLLPSGTRTNNISQLLHSPRMEALIARLRTEFDMVIIDAPPMMHLADARLLGGLSDGVVLVVRAGHTMREAAFDRQPATVRRRNANSRHRAQQLGSAQNSGSHLRIWLRLWLWLRLRPERRSQGEPPAARLVNSRAPDSARSD